MQKKIDLQQQLPLQGNMKAKLQFLGTGTSQGIPVIGCNCEVCKSCDKRDNRLRSSVLVEYGGLTILVDAGPDFREQMLRAGVTHLDAILLTHNHKDHTGGLDDVRSLNYIDSSAAEIYCEEKVLNSLKCEYPYVFAEKKYIGAPEWHVHIIENKPFLLTPAGEEDKLTWVHNVGYCKKNKDGELVPSDNDIISYAPLAVGNNSSDNINKAVTIIPIRGYHDTMPVLGFRFGNIAYITDMSSIPEEEFAKLKNLDYVTLNTVGYKKHHSHFSFDEALALAEKIGAKHTYLTHLSHAFPKYEEFIKTLPENVSPAYDGLIL